MTTLSITAAPDPSFRAGDRVRINDEGRRVGIHAKVGTVPYDQTDSAVAVLWDGQRRPTFYAARFVEKVEVQR